MVERRVEAGRDLVSLGPEKAADAQKSLEFFKQHGLNVKIADEAERKKLRDMVYPKAKEAYIASAGPGGKEMIELYEKELAALSK